MVLIRMIKLKILNGELNNLTEPEQFFISLFNEISYDKNKDYYYTVDNVAYFRYDYNGDILYSSIGIFHRFYVKFNFTFSDYNKMIDDLFKRHFNKKTVSKFSSSLK